MSQEQSQQPLLQAVIQELGVGSTGDGLLKLRNYFRVRSKTLVLMRFTEEKNRNEELE